MFRAGMHWLLDHLSHVYQVDRILVTGQAARADDSVDLCTASQIQG